MTPDEEERVREIVKDLLDEFEAKLIDAFLEGLKPIQPHEVGR